MQPKNIASNYEMSEIDKVLAERGERYGEFDQLANLSQNLKRTMRAHPGWLNLDDDMRESLEMIQHKIARILNGDPHYIDSWVDKEGYSRLVSDRLKRDQEHHDASFLSSIALHGMGDDD